MSEKNIIDTEISDKDVFEAMKDIPGYLDITPGDFRELYRKAYDHAVKRISHAKAKDIMTTKVVTVDRDTPLKYTAKLMADNSVAGIPVLAKDKKVAGIISEKDFLSRMGGEDVKTFMGIVAQCLKGKGCVALSIREKRAEDIMTSPAVTVTEETSVMNIVKIFKEKKINRVPVVDGHGELVGIVSRNDIVEAPLLKG